MPLGDVVERRHGRLLVHVLLADTINAATTRK
jgi:hypothetical protein